jgi:hypothetical protein
VERHPDSFCGHFGLSLVMFSAPATLVHSIHVPAHCLWCVLLAAVMRAVSGFVARFANIPVVSLGLYRAYFPCFSQEIIEETG